MGKPAQQSSSEGKGTPLALFKDLASKTKSAREVDRILGKSIVVFNLPQNDVSKKNALSILVRKNLTKYLEECNIEIDDSMEVTLFDDGTTTKNYCILTFNSAAIADVAASCISGFEHQAGKSFLAWTLLDFKEAIVPNPANQRVFITETPATIEADAKLQPWWTLDPNNREEFVCDFDGIVEIYRHNLVSAEQESIACIKYPQGSTPTIRQVLWSPMGSYLAILDNDCVNIYGGPKLSLLTCIVHAGVKCFKFSPMETFLLTYNGSEIGEMHPDAFAIHLICPGMSTSKTLRYFPVPNYSGSEYAQPGRDVDSVHRIMINTMYTFSYDDKYAACMKLDQLCIYELPQCTIILNHDRLRFPIPFARIEKFDWCPSASMIAVWCSSHQDGLGRFSLLEVPTLKELSSRHIFNVKETALNWQTKGDLLCLRTRCFHKVSKSQKRKIVHLEIIRAKEKNIPVDSVAVENLNVKQFHWEGGLGNRFALILEDEATATVEMHFYCVFDSITGKSSQLVEKMPMKSGMNHMSWSPTGIFFIVAALGVSGRLHFCMLNENNRVQTLRTIDVSCINGISWSPCGRYVAAATIALDGIFESRMNAGVQLFTFQGRQLLQRNIKMLHNFAWRSRPLSVWGSLDDKFLEENMNHIDNTENERLAMQKAAREAYQANELKQLQAFNAKMQKIDTKAEENTDFKAWKADYYTFEASVEYEVNVSVTETEISTEWKRL